MQPDEDHNWQGRALLFGAIIGALTGVGGAYLYIQSQRKSGREGSGITPGSAVKIGLLLLGLLRQVGEITEGTGKKG